MTPGKTYVLVVVRIGAIAIVAGAIMIALVSRSVSLKHLNGRSTWRHGNQMLTWLLEPWPLYMYPLSDILGDVVVIGGNLIEWGFWSG
jgi:hypothetical protein